MKHYGLEADRGEARRGEIMCTLMVYVRAGGVVKEPIS